MPKPKREYDQAVSPASWSMLCGAEFLRSPAQSPQVPFQCATCGFWHSTPDCHQCSCQVCPMLWARHVDKCRGQLQRGLFDCVHCPVPVDSVNE